MRRGTKITLCVVLTLTAAASGTLAALKFFKPDTFVLLSDSAMSTFYQLKSGIDTDDIVDILNYENPYFKAKEIDGKLSAKEGTSLSSTSVKLNVGADIYTIPVPDVSMSSNFSDTVFADDGSFYIVALDDDSEMVQEYLYDDVNLGYGRPAVFTLEMPSATSKVFIQCYDNSTYAFFNNLDPTADFTLSAQNDHIDMDPSDAVKKFDIVDLHSIPPYDEWSTALAGKYSYVRDLATTDMEVGGFVYDGGAFYARYVGLTYDKFVYEVVRLQLLGHSVNATTRTNGLYIIDTDMCDVILTNVTDNSYLIYYTK